MMRVKLFLDVSTVNLTELEEMSSEDMFLELRILGILQDHGFRARLFSNVPNEEGDSNEPDA